MSNVVIDAKVLEGVVMAFGSVFNPLCQFFRSPDGEKLLLKELKKAMQAEVRSEGVHIFHELKPFAFSVVAWQALPGKTLKLMTLIDSPTDLKHKILSTDQLKKYILGSKSRRSSIVITSHSRVLKYSAPMPVGIVALYLYLLALWKLWFLIDVYDNWEDDVDNSVLISDFTISCFTQSLYELSRTPVEELPGSYDRVHFTLNLLHAGAASGRLLEGTQRTPISLPVDELNIVMPMLVYSGAPIYVCTLEELPCLVNQTFPEETGFALVGDLHMRFRNLFFGAIWEKKRDGGVVVRMHPTITPFKMNDISNEAFETLSGQIQNLRKLEFCDILLPHRLIGAAWVLLGMCAQFRLSPGSHEGVIKPEYVEQFRPIALSYFAHCKSYDEANRQDQPAMFYPFHVDALLPIIPGLSVPFVLFWIAMMTLILLSMERAR